MKKQPPLKQWIVRYRNEYGDECDLVFRAESYAAACKEAYSHEPEYGIFYDIRLEPEK